MLCTHWERGGQCPHTRPFWRTRTAQNLMREYMRSNDRAMSNLEALPGGFNALRQLYENVQEPLMNATQGMGAGGDAAANPLASMLAAAGLGSGAAAGGGSGGGAGGAAAGNTSPEGTQPLPNPWAAGGGAGGSPARLLRGGGLSAHCASGKTAGGALTCAQRSTTHMRLFARRCHRQRSGCWR